MHAGSGDDELLLRERLAEVPGVVACQRLPEVGDSPLPGVERLAAGQGLRRGIGDEGGCRQIALAGPERDQTLAQAAVVDDGDNAAFRCGAGFGAKLSIRLMDKSVFP